METQVLIVGAGPVGLTVAMSLAQRGVAVTVVETRAAGEPPNVKCNHVSARSMEIFRRLGVAAAVRGAGLPPDYPHSVSYRTTTTGPELARIEIPSRSRRFTRTDGPDGNWPTPEPPHRINQIYLEPILFAHAAATPGVTILNRTELTGFAQDTQGVTAQIRALDTGAESALHAAYLIGCDGGRSGVRKAIGARLEGDAVVQRVQSTLIRAPQMIGLMQAEPAWAMFSLNPRRQGNIYAIDGRALWLIHNYLRPDEPDFASVDRDASIRAILGVGPEFAYEIVSNEDWFGRRLVADRFRDRRVFICGDAAHIWVPYAGYGMNAGIADAENLAWLLAAHLQGWGDAAILDAHEAERHPITEQVSRFAMNHAEAMARQRGSVPPEIEAETPEGAAARHALGAQAYALNVQQYACAGLNFGYYYDASPIIAADDEPPPPYAMGSFTASSVPGCRLPHQVTPEGGSLYDLMGTGYTLLRRDASVEVAPLVAAARAQGLPLTVLEVPWLDDPAYRHALLIARPDLHLAWRGDRLPDDPAALVALLRGAGSARRARQGEAA